MVVIKNKITVGKDVEKLGPLCFAAGNIKWCSHSMWPFIRRVNTELPYNPATPLLGLYPKEVTTGIRRCWHTRVHSSMIHNSQKVETSPVSINR